MKKFTLVYFTLAVTLIVIVSRQKGAQATPLFFDKLQRLFGGGGGGYGQRPNKNPWNGGSQYQKQKKFPWDIFGIFGYKNVIRPGGRPNGGRPPRPLRPGPTFRPIHPNRPVTFRPTNRPTFRPTVTGRPPFFPPTTTWPNNCNCGWDIVNQNGQPQLVDTNGPQIVTAPPSINNPQVLVTAAPPSVVLGKPGGAALPPSDISGATQIPPSSFRNSVRTPVNLGGGTFNAAQQFYPASEFPDNLPKYSPNLPARRRRPTTTAVPNLNDFGSNSVTTPDATTVTNSIDVEDFEIDELAETTTFLPRQNRNRDLDKSVLLQPDFGVDVLEEPSAEPLNTHGDGWIPMTPQEVNQVFDGGTTTEKPSLPPPPFLDNQPRAPKVLQWFDNPYFIQQEPQKPLTNNLQNEIEISKTKLHDLNPEKVKPEKISISQNPSAFEKSVHNLATLAYATEENFEESTEQFSAKNDDLITDNPKPKSLSSIFNWGTTAENPTETGTTTEFSKFSKSNFWQQTTSPTTAKPVVNGWFMKLLDGNQTKENEINEQPLQLNKMSEKPLEVNVPEVKFFEPADAVVNTEDPIFNWVWTDVNDDAEYIGEFHDDDLRDPDMTTIGTGTAAVLDEKFPYPTLEPGFDLLSDDWFQNQVENRTILPNHQDLLYDDENDNENEEKMLATTSDKFMLYYPISGTPFLSFSPKLEIASIVKK